MLKSIVNGAEHDIVSIPMKGKNLLNLNRTYSNSFTTDTTKWMNGAATVNNTGTTYAETEILGDVIKVTSKNPGYGASFLIEASPNTTYTVSFETDKEASGSWGAISDRNISGTVISTAAIQGKSATFTTHGNCAFLNVCFRFPPADGTVTFSNIMLNLGSTALPYEPYGYQNGWEVRDNQNRIIWGREDELQTTTGTLLFKGYDLPIKVNSLLGNATQNGTPSPDNVVVPEFCGVRTKNICPSATAETKTNNGITAVSNGSGTYHVSGTATADADIRFNVQSFWIPQSIGNYHDGTFSMFNSAIYNNKDVKLVFYYQGTKIDDWGLTTRNRTSTTYAIMSEKDCDAIGFTVKSGITVDFTISPEFTNDGVLPTEFEPYGWKVPFENHGENLLNKTEFTGVSATIEQVDNGIQVITENGGYAARIVLDVQENTDYTLSYIWKKISGAASNVTKVFAGTGSSTEIAAFSNNTGGTFNTGNNKKINIWFYAAFGAKATVEYTNIMLNSGSTPLPYSPYLNKTTPIYLSEVPTIRRIKKLVLTGESDVDNMFEYNGFIYVQKSGMLAEVNVPFCNCLIGTNLPIADAPTNSVKQGIVSNQPYPAALVFKIDGITTTTGFLNFLSTMKSAGTPVTIWYILETPQTGIVNEPLAKIGNYADELTEISVHNLSAPLYGIGDYKDILNLSTGVLTRKIKKYAFTGNEDSLRLYTNSAGKIGFNIEKLDMLSNSRTNGFCTHFVSVQSTSWVYDNGVCFGANNAIIYFVFSDVVAEQYNITDLTSIKSYLQDQYTNGTPVTVWYILETPTTETVTVPTRMTGEIEGYLKQISTPTPEHPSIPKWNGKEETGGTYAVIVYNLPEIPTTTGKNTLTVETEKIHGLTNPLCGIGDYKDVLNLSTGIITRKIKKLVLTGEETWSIDGGKAGVYSATNASLGISDLFQSYAYQLSSHFALADSYNTIFYNTEYFAIQNSRLIISYFAKSSVDSFKSYLQQQYASGTPVTIWYVVNTPETETITVPYGLECSVEGYLTQSGTSTPSNPITPESNGILESDGTYAVEVSLVPSNLTVKGHIKPVQ